MPSPRPALPENIINIIELIKKGAINTEDGEKNLTARINALDINAPLVNQSFIAIVDSLNRYAKDEDDFNSLITPLKIKYLALLNKHTPNDFKLEYNNPLNLLLIFVFPTESHTDKLKLLLASFDINQFIQGGFFNDMNALHIAAINNFHETANILITNGANIEMMNLTGENALHLAAWHGHHKMIQLLHASGMNLNTLSQNQSALHLATLNSHIKVIKALLDLGVDINTLSRSKKTPLHLAAKHGLNKSAKALLENGAKINMLTPGGENALHLAAWCGDTNIIEMLHSRGLNIHAVTFDNETALHLAAQNDRHEAIMLLLDLGADVNAKLGNGATALHLAAENGNDKTVKALLAKGADLNILTNEGKSALSLAAKNQYDYVMNTILLHQMLKNKTRKTIQSIRSQLSKELGDDKAKQHLDNINKAIRKALQESLNICIAKAYSGAPETEEIPYEIYLKIAYKNFKDDLICSFSFNDFHSLAKQLDFDKKIDELRLKATALRVEKTTLKRKHNQLPHDLAHDAEPETKKLKMTAASSSSQGLFNASAKRSQENKEDINKAPHKKPKSK